MLPAEPLVMQPDIPDTAVSSAMCSKTERVDIPVDVVRQAIVYVHVNVAPELNQQIVHAAAGAHGYSSQSSY
jgi:hypothetical protein